MKRYKELQIVKHAIQHYMQRPEATEKEIHTEQLVLQNVTDEVNLLKEAYHISKKTNQDGGIKLIFDTKKAKQRDIPPYQVEQMEKANLNSEILKACDIHEFEPKAIKAAVRESKATNWTTAKCKCNKCGGEVFALYAGGYMDAVKQLKRRKSNEH